MKLKEFTKFSIHNHFGGASADRVRNRPFSYLFDSDKAKAKIDSAVDNDYELLGFTNHNILPISDYLFLKTYAQTKGVLLLPGVEIDLVNDIHLPLSNRKFLHVVVVFDENVNLQIVKKKIDDSIIDNHDACLTITQFCELAVEFKCIVVPHGNKQRERSSGENPYQTEEILGMYDMIPIFVEDNRKYQKVFAQNKLQQYLNLYDFKHYEELPSISCSDQEEDFSNIPEPTYVWGDKSFSALFYAALIGKSRIIKENDYQTKPAVISKIVLKNNGGCLKDSTIICSHGLNTIIGPSGSGKTLLLNLISKKIRNSNLINSASSTTCDYESLYKDTDIILYNANNDAINVGDFNIFEGQNLYNQIITTFKSKKSELLNMFKVNIDYTNFDSIIDEFNKNLYLYLNNSKKKIELSSNLSESIKSLLDSITYLKINKVEKNVISYNKNPKFLEDKDKYLNLWKEIINDIKSFDDIKATLDKLADKYSINKDLYKAINKFAKELEIKKKYIGLSYWKAQEELLIDDKLSEITTSFIENLGLKFLKHKANKQKIIDESSNIVKFLKNIVYIETILQDVPVINKDKLINSLNKDFGSFVRLNDINIITKLNYDNLDVLFSPSIGGVNKISKTLFKPLFLERELDLSVENDVKKFLDVFSKNYVNDVSNVFAPNKNDILSYKIEVKNDNNQFVDINTLSAGQLSKLYINKVFDEELNKKGPNTIILYDQPDNNLEKKFIIDELAKKLNSLKLEYQIFITTHEPLLVINGDSNAIIEASSEKTLNKDISISFNNIDITNSSNKKDAIQRVAELIDGSKEAIKLRSNLYGGMSDE